MIIWGWRGREIEQERGEFHCPQCDESQEYSYVRVATYFTLYFIPLFETEHHGDYVECLNCQGQFRPEVLDYTPASQEERVLASVRADLESGTPLQMARTKLENDGIEREVAEQLVTAAGRGEQRTCTACKLSFVPSVRRCSGCGASLSAETGIRSDPGAGTDLGGR